MIVVAEGPPIAQIRKHNRTPIGPPFRVSSAKFNLPLSSLEGLGLARRRRKSQTGRVESEGQSPVPASDAQAAVYRRELYYGRLPVQ
jgi:hypothetical protein